MLITCKRFASDNHQVDVFKESAVRAHSDHLPLFRRLNGGSEHLP